MTGPSYPDGYALSFEPHCGVLSVAMCAGVSFERAWDACGDAGTRGPGWRGLTDEGERRAALVALGVRFSEALAIPTRRMKRNPQWGGMCIARCSVSTFAAKRAKPGVTYMVRIKRHVVTVRDGMVADQSGISPAARHPTARRMICSVWTILS